jgi:CRISPR-associated exonuclease Cas4
MPALILLLLALALLFWILSRRVSQASGLPQGRLVYVDTGAWGRLEKPLFSKRLQLTGKPDYVVRDGKQVVPVEVKSGRAPADGPYESHVYQLAAYCALVEETYGRRPAYGLIRYADKTWAVDYTQTLEDGLERLLDEIRLDSTAPDVARSHDSAARCRACGFKEMCEERLGG